MLKTLSRWIALGVLIGCAPGIAYAQNVSVSLPELFSTDAVVDVPITVDDLTGENIQAFTLTVAFDPAIVEVVGARTEESLSAGFSVIENTTVTGRVTIAAANATTIAGAGTLITLQFRFVGDGVTDLIFDEFTFNEGDPEAGTVDGALSNAGPINNENESGLPEALRVAGHYPNPAHNRATILVDVPEAADVTIVVHDLLGREVLRTSGESVAAGYENAISIDASSLASGIYLYEVRAATLTSTTSDVGKMTVVH